MSSSASAHHLLEHTLKGHVETVREAVKRVLATSSARRSAAAAGRPAGEADTKEDAATGDAAKEGAAKGATAMDAAATEGAATDAQNADEAVHDFRVAIRRLRTWLQPARKIYGKKRLRAIADGLKRYADVTSALRDEEVLRETLASLLLHDKVRSALDAWIVRRARQERSRRTDVAKLLRGAHATPSRSGRGDEPSLEKCLARLEKRLRRPKDEDTSAAELGERAIAKAQAKIRELGEVDLRDVSAMHALRIHYKRLRYTAELFAPAIGEGASRTAKDASRLQTRLGDLHDVDQAIVRIARARGLSSEVRSAVIDALRDARSRRMERCAKELAESGARSAGASPSDAISEPS